MVAERRPGGRRDGIGDELDSILTIERLREGRSPGPPPFKWRCSASAIGETDAPIDPEAGTLEPGWILVVNVEQVIDAAE
jgi:hypothetical protein